MQTETRKVLIWSLAGGVILGIHICLLFQGINPIWVYFNMLLGIFAVYVAVLIGREVKTAEVKKEVVEEASDARENLRD